MNTLTNTTTTTTRSTTLLQIRASSNEPPQSATCHNHGRRTSLLLLSGLVITSRAETSQAIDREPQRWGTRSFIREKYFAPQLSPEDSAARIKQTAEGLHNMRDMLENMAWRYVLFYVRLKISYLSQDLKNALSTLPLERREDYVRAANDLVANMGELDEYIRSPKVYESYVYYEKTLKSIDEVVAILQV